MSLILHGFDSQNNFKVLYTLEALHLNYELKYYNLIAGEHKTSTFSRMNPVGKTPVLEHDGFYLFESNAICRYLTNMTQSPLYPQEFRSRALVDQWIDYLTNHLGLWLGELFFEYIIKKRANLGLPDPLACDEATKYCHTYFQILENHLAESKFLAGSKISLSDICALAYIEQIRLFPCDFSKYERVQNYLCVLDEQTFTGLARDQMTAAKPH